MDAKGNSRNTCYRILCKFLQINTDPCFLIDRDLTRPETYQNTGQQDIGTLTVRPSLKTPEQRAIQAASVCPRSQEASLVRSCKLELAK